MTFDRRRLLQAASILTLEAAARQLFASPAPNNLYRVSDPKTILAAARAILAEDTIATLITVDADAHPRARSILVSKPDDDLSLWMATRPGSRKLDQLRANPAATLHFADDAQAAYLSLMGEARINTDPATIQAKNPYGGVSLAKYFPNFPADFVLLGFKARWLELATSEIPSKSDTWQPQGLKLP